MSAKLGQNLIPAGRGVLGSEPQCCGGRANATLPRQMNQSHSIFISVQKVFKVPNNHPHVTFSVLLHSSLEPLPRQMFLPYIGTLLNT